MRLAAHIEFAGKQRIELYPKYECGMIALRSIDIRSAGTSLLKYNLEHRVLAGEDKSEDQKQLATES